MGGARRSLGRLVGRRSVVLLVVMAILAGLAPASQLSPAAAQGTAAGRGADDPRDGWRPASEGGEPEELDGPRKFAEGGVPREDPAPTAKKLPPAKRVKEIPERRTANSKVFQLEDGRVQEELSAAPLHYRDEQGRWQPIDPKVAPSSRPGFTLGNVTNGFRTFFGEDPTALVRFETDKGAVTLATPDATPGKPVAKDNKVTYADGIRPGVDLAYEVTPESLKESIVLEAAPAGDDDVVVEFDLNVEGLEARQRDDGAVVFGRPGGDGDDVMMIPAPFMMDAADDAASPYGKAWSPKVTQTLSADGKSLTLTADGEWLRAEEREYPVVIDPTIRIVPTPTVSQDTMILSEPNAANSNFESSWRLSVGTTPVDPAQNNQYGIARSLLKFPVDIPQGTKIDSAHLQLYYDQSHTTASPAVTLEAHAATAFWSETSATWNNANNNVGALGSYSSLTDDGDTWWTAVTGTWPYSTNSSQTTHAVNTDFAYNGDATTGQKYTWYPCVKESGTYKVEAHFVTAPDRATAAPYTVNHKGGATNVNVNQSAATVGSKWTSLGDFAFDAGCATGSVVLSDVANKYVIADAIRWTKAATAVRPAGDNGGHWHDFTVQNLVQGWVDQPGTNNGFVVKAANEGTAGQGGPRYESSNYAYNSEGANRPRLVITYGREGVTLNLPTTFHATGAELSWPLYVDPCTLPVPVCTDDDLVEYQVHRSVNQTFTPNASTLVAPVAPPAPGPTTVNYTDTSATPTPAGDDDETGKAYYYMVAVKTKDGQVVPGPTRLARLPVAGQVKRIYYADYDTTLSASEPNTAHDTMFGEPWLYAGNNIAPYGITRSLVKFPALTAIPTTAKVVKSEVRLWNREVNATGSPVWQMHGLNRDFNELQATWTKANSTTNWTAAGGDFGAVIDVEPDPAIPPDPADPNWTNDPTRRRFTATSLVQNWVATPTSNKGVLVKLANETTPQARANFLSSEGEEPELRPELWVTYMEKTPESTYYAPATPEAVESTSTSAIPVTLTNTTPVAWDEATWDLSYRWTLDGTVVTTPQPALKTPLGTATVKPGETVTVNAQVKAPEPSADGNQRTDYVLNWDLIKPTGAWLSAEPALNAVGALKQSMAVEESTSDQVGLESFYAYAGKGTGAGGSVMNNLHAGNAVWSYDAFSNPSRGLSTFVRLAYNSKDVSDSVAGFGWSLQASSVMRLGTPLDPHPNSHANRVYLTDGDGTTHYWTMVDDKGNSDPLDDVYAHPAGVHLYLQRMAVCQPNNTKDPETRAWVMTKPDRTQFFFDCAGYVSSVVDKNGNQMTFVYEERKSNNKPTKFLRYIEDATGRRTLTIDYFAKGQSYPYINSTTWTRQSATNLTNPFIIDKVQRITDISGRKLSLTYTDKGLLGEMIDGEGSTQPKVFKFAYDMTQGNKNVKLVKVTDPRGNATNLSYYSNPEDDPKFKWSLKTITDRLTFPTTFTYRDPDGGAPGPTLETKVTDAENHTTTFLMDSKGRPTQSTNAKNQATKLTWDADNNVERLEEANGAISTWLYDQKTGYPLEIKDAEAYKNGWAPTTLRYQVGLSGNIADLIEKQSPEGRLWKFGYTGEGDLASVTDPLGTLTPADPNDYTTKYTYDTWGQLLTATDANGNVTKNSSFHPTGYPQTIADPRQWPLGKGTDFVYDDRGQVLQVIDANEKTTTQTYDVYGRPLENKVPKRQDAQELILTPAPVYDANDNITKVTGPELWVGGARVGEPGAVSDASYDAADQLSYSLAPKDEAIDPERKTSFTYDKVGNLLTTTEPKGNLTPTVPGDFITRNAYDEIYQLIDVANASGDKLSYRYDNVGNVTHVVDPRKNLTSDPNDYTSWIWTDQNHRPVVALDAINAYEVTTYDRDGLVVARDDKAQNKTLITLDARGMAKEVKVPHDNPGGTISYRTTQFEYDQVGNRTKVITPRGVNTPAAGDFVHESVYDELNRVKEQLTPFDPTNPDYNAAVKTTFAYDDVGRLTTVSAPPSHNQTVRNDTAYTYFDNGWTATAEDPWDITTSYDYNPLGQQISNKLTPGGAGPADPESPNRTMGWDYFPDGKLESRSDTGVPFGRHVVLTDNSDAQSTGVVGTWPRASSSPGFHGYDYATHDAGAGTDSFTWYVDVPQDGDYEVFVRYPEVTGAADDASFKVTHKDNVETTTTVNQTTGAGTWVKLGKYPFAQGAAKVALAQNPDGKVVADGVKLVRDTTGQPDDESRAFLYDYDPNGNLTKISDNSSGAGVDTYDVSYSGLNQVEQVQENKTGQAPVVSTFTYDPNGAIKTTTHPKAYAAFEYDPRNLLSKVTNGVSAADPAPKVTEFTYTPRGERLKETKGNGNTVDYGYFLNGQLKSQVEKKPNGTLVSQHTVTYEPNGNRATDVSKKMNADNVSAYLETTATYTYDPRDRLSGVTRTGAGAGTETYKHDNNDNVISQTIDGGTTTFAYDRNRLVTRQAGPFVFGINYDPFGRVQSEQVFGIEQSRYTYDGFDRTLSHKAGGKTTAYTYDPLDRTATKTTDAGTASAKETKFKYLGLSGEVLNEEVAGAVTKSYQYSPWGERLSQVTHKAGGVKEDAYYGYNPHSDVETLTNTSGNTTATYGYTAYGNSISAEFTGVDKPVAGDPTKEPYNPYRFNAKRWDANSSSYDMGFRDYSPGLNRFLTRDMYNGALADMNLGLNPYTSNRYAFTAGNPINRLDGDGHGTIPDGGDWNYKYKPLEPEPEPTLNWETDECVDDCDSTVCIDDGCGTIVDLAYEKYRDCSTGVRDNLWNNWVWSRCQWSPGAASDGNKWTRKVIQELEGDLRDHVEFHPEDTWRLEPPPIGPTANGYGNLSQANKYGIKPYNALKSELTGSGLQAHHLLEKRFAKILGVSEGQMGSVAVTKAEHQVFTNAWRSLIPYGSGTANATRDQVMGAAKEIYAEYPAILKALGLS